MQDIVQGRYSDIHLSSFITACAARGLNEREIVGLTRAMVRAGESLTWDKTPVVDKHCVGGLPGNRTTPIIVAIVAACGLTMPKTSSRAITSPAGTADTMETLAPVDLSLTAMRRVVEREGGCVVWGGAVALSPADDTLIRVERALDIDSEGQLVASVLSKKAAAGATHLVLDLPVGPTAKVRSPSDADSLSDHLLRTARAFGIEARAIRTDGRQPVGRGVGPALEARDVVAVLEGAQSAPQDLKDRAVALAGVLLELGGAAAQGAGAGLAQRTLADGRAWAKFQAICEAQGGMRKPPQASQQWPLAAHRAGRIISIDNRRLGRAAKLAGAPGDKAAGLEMHGRLDDVVEKGAPLFTLHAETRGELDYARAFIEGHPPIIEIEPTR
jgi:thymidine phosphorylase